LPLIGSKEGIMHICMTYFSEGDAILVPNPGYPTYASAVKLSGGMPLYYDLLEKNSYEPDFGNLENLIENAKSGHNKINGLFVNYPHMPTGQLPSKELFEKLVAFAMTHKVLIIHDNPYSFILNDEPMSILRIDGAKQCAVELNSLSKSHNMAGWRVGMLCGAAERIEEVLRFKSNMDSGMFLPIQLAAARGLSLGKEWYEQVNSVYVKRRKKVYQLLDALACRYSAKQAGLFVWARIPNGFNDGYDCSDHVLHNSRVFITPGGIFGSEGNNYVRVSLCATEEKIDEAIRRIHN